MIGHLVMSPSRRMEVFVNRSIVVQVFQIFLVNPNRLNAADKNKWEYLAKFCRMEFPKVLVATEH